MLRIPCLNFLNSCGIFAIPCLIGLTILLLTACLKGLINLLLNAFPKGLINRFLTDITPFVTAAIGPPIVAAVAPPLK